MGKVRIIGGRYRSRILTFKDINGLRPTLDRVRETIFNWLGQELNGQQCLDLFAGSGALGFEALSRSAKHVTLVERDPTIVKQLRLNQELLNAPNLEIIKCSAISYLETCKHQFDVIFLDPPYIGTLLQQSLSIIKNTTVLDSAGVIYIECQEWPDLTGYEIIKQNKAGRVNYALLRQS